MKKNKLEKVKFINDPVYGVIAITQVELEIIDTPIFQRLRGLRQLARVNFVFPGAEHSRFSHSLGVLFIMGLMTEHLYNKEMISEDDVVKMRVAALLHDIGHYPLSHLGERAYSYLELNKKVADILEGGSSPEPTRMYQVASYNKKDGADHEYLGKYIITHNNDIVTILEKYKLDPQEIGEIITGEYGSRNMVYTQLLHSSLDADRLDYLLRDSFQTGVKYGLVDLQYLIRLLEVVDSEIAGSKSDKILACNKKGQHVVEHFLMSRYFHYSQIIFHKTNASFEGMIKCLYVKLLQNNKYMFNSFESIQNAVNDISFLNFNDAFLDVAFKNYYDETEDEEYRQLYEMYRDRIRPKVIFELKDLYDKDPKPKMSILKRELEQNPNHISEIVGSDKWGYQIVPIRLEKIHLNYKLSEGNPREEDYREAVKLFNPDDEKVTYLGADELSVVGRLSDYTSQFIRIYVLEEKATERDYKEMHDKINKLIG